MMPAKKQKIIPACVGEFEAGDQDCNGDPKSKNPNVARQCAWRVRCVAFQSYLEATGKEVADHLEVVITYQRDDDGNIVMDPKTKEEVVTDHRAEAKKGHEGFVAFCNRLAEAYQVKDGKITREPTPAELDPKEGPKAKVTKPSTVPKRTKSRKPKSKAEPTKPKSKPVKAAPLAPKSKRIYPRVEARTEEMLGLFMHFLRALYGAFPKGRIVAEKRAARPGQLYVVDRRDTGGYLSIYCRTAMGWDQCLAKVTLRPVTRTLDIQVPVTVEALNTSVGRRTRKKFKTRNKIDGRLKAEVLKVDKEASGLLAEAIFKLTENGDIELPGV